MKMVEARDILFRDYIEWMKVKKGATPDRFSMEIWASRIFDLWYGEYAEEKKRGNLANEVLKIYSATEIEQILHRKKLMDLNQSQQREALLRQQLADTEEARKKEKVPDNINAADEVVDQESVPGEEVPTLSPEEAQRLLDAQSGVTDIPSTPEGKVVDFPAKKKRGLFNFGKKK